MRMARDESLREERLAKDRARIEKDQRRYKQLLKMFMLAYGRKP